jgi:hypothetical protein
LRSTHPAARFVEEPSRRHPRIFHVPGGELDCLLMGEETVVQ